MDNRFRAGLMAAKQMYTEPWNMRQARVNVITWSAVTFVLLTNMTINLVTAESVIRWVWLGCTIVMLGFDATVLRWSFEGLMWRKLVERNKWEEEQFRAMVARELRDR